MKLLKQQNHCLEKLKTNKHVVDTSITSHTLILKNKQLMYLNIHPHLIKFEFKLSAI